MKPGLATHRQRGESRLPLRCAAFSFGLPVLAARWEAHQSLPVNAPRCPGSPTRRAAAPCLATWAVVVSDNLGAHPWQTPTPARSNRPHPYLSSPSRPAVGIGHHPRPKPTNKPAKSAQPAATPSWPGCATTPAPPAKPCLSGPSPRHSSPTPPSRPAIAPGSSQPSPAPSLAPVEEH